jgi:hypothetical protein
MFGYIVWTRRSYQLLQQNQEVEHQQQPQQQQQQQPPPPAAAADHRGQGAVPAVGAEAAGAAGAAVGADAARVAAARARPINANDPSIVQPPPPPSTTTSTWSLGPGTSTSRDPLTESTTQRKKRFLSMSGGTSFGLGGRGSSGNSVKNNDNNLKETEMKTISLDD